MPRLIRVLLAAICATCAGSLPAIGEPVPIDNASFENDVLADGTFLFGANGWTCTGDAGCLNPTVVNYYGGNAVEGNNLGFVQRNPGGLPAGVLAQVLRANLQPETRYTFTMAIGNRLDSPLMGFKYRVQLFAGGELCAQAINAVEPKKGYFLTFTMKYESPRADDRIGRPLEIRIIAEDGQMNLDFVRLDSTPIQICKSDFNRDGSVDDFDLFDLFTALFLNDPLADWNRDGAIDDFDLFDFLNAFVIGEC
ncbi:MAG: hypothetical protein JNM07_00280 [Phycisphaerae bacterium]|nr:hypothetical protein [Phycisphaerae bacterium]